MPSSSFFGIASYLLCLSFLLFLSFLPSPYDPWYARQHFFQMPTSRNLLTELPFQPISIRFCHSSSSFLVCFRSSRFLRACQDFRGVGRTSLPTWSRNCAPGRWWRYILHCAMCRFLFLITDSWDTNYNSSHDLFPCFSSSFPSLFSSIRVILLWRKVILLALLLELSTSFVLAISLASVPWLPMRNELPLLSQLPNVFAFASIARLEAATDVSENRLPR